ncbi:4'-phosphopantetheinyl transferase family protein [Lacihabitans lacunae]|uniref:4'-phosphopantetheinyl transferase family protein n=1 Tax=Lacihabitans lacunae TaxID=1028214 RepID=A0ABV7YUA2_9BACT
MPVFINKIIDNQIHVLVWQVRETYHEALVLAKLSELGKQELESIANEQKRIEFLISRIAIKELASRLNIDFSGIGKDEHGKPFLINSHWEISITHTVDFIGVVFREKLPLGMDIEKPQNKMLKVLPRLMVDSEIELMGDSLEYATIFWSAKEALYKLYGKRKVDFKENLLVWRENEQWKGKIKMPDYEAEHSFYIEMLDQYLMVIAY